MEGISTELISIRGKLRTEFLYTYSSYTNKLHRANLLTGELTCHQVPGYRFKELCGCSELPGGSLLITGGSPSEGEVVKIDTQRECAVTSFLPMHTARHHHAAVYHSQYLYVLGGYYARPLYECERYVFAESRWEVLPVLPVACCAMSAVVLDNSLYALGGLAHPINLDSVQKLSLDSLSWQLMQLNLPQACYSFPCFKIDSEVYLVIKETLYSFTPLRVKPSKILPHSICCYSSYYSRGTLYYSINGEIKSFAIGELTSL
jgi:hypothetical protein